MSIGLRAVPEKEKARVIPFGVVLCIMTFSFVLFAGVFYVTGSFAYRTLAVALGVSVCFFLLLIKGERNVAMGVVLVFMVLGPFALFNANWSDWRSLYTVFVLLAAYGTSWYVIQARKTVVFYEVPFYFLLFCTVALVVFFDFGPAEFNSFIGSGSRNVYSSVLIATACGYVLSRRIRNKPPSLLLFLLLFVVHIPLYGRSGIFFSFLMFLGVLLSRGKSRGKVILYVSFVFLACLGGFSCYQLLVDFLLGKTNFSFGLDSPRLVFIQDYISVIGASSLFIGFDFTTVPSIAAYDGNPHNAFLRLHGYYGVASIVLLLFVIVSILLLLLDREVLLFWVLFVYLGRAFFDIVYFINLVDFFVMPTIMYIFFRSILRLKGGPVIG